MNVIRSKFWFKLKLIPAVFRARDLVMITDKSEWSTVTRYNDKPFWLYVRKRLTAHERKHNLLRCKEDLDEEAEG